jgi:hypothetical protein
MPGTGGKTTDCKAPSNPASKSAKTIKDEQKRLEGPTTVDESPK